MSIVQHVMIVESQGKQRNVDKPQLLCNKLLFNLIDHVLVNISLFSCANDLNWINISFTAMKLTTGMHSTRISRDHDL